MRLLVAAFGTRGDLEPLLALGLALRHRGHDVTIGAAPLRRSLTQQHGLPFRPIGSWPNSRFSRVARSLIGQEADPGRRGMMLIERVLAPLFPTVVNELRAASSGYDGIVVNDLLAFALLGEAPLPGIRVVVAVLTQPCGGLSSFLQERRGLKLIASSRALHPHDIELGDDYVFTNHWLMETKRAFAPSTSLQHFLSAGPTVAVTMGSAWGRNPNLERTLFVAAAKKAGVRLVVQELPAVRRPRKMEPGILSIGEIPYDWLFSHVTCVLHHGGAGTSAIALRAGRPCITLPQYGDQHYWALRLEMLGASAATLTDSRITVDALAEAMHRGASEPGLRTAAIALGKKIDTRAGLLTACERIEEDLAMNCSPDHP